MARAQVSEERRHGVPRGLARTGPVLFSYGFRPFFLGAGIAAVAAMALWIAALTTGLPIGGDYGAVAWHGHEMLFGFGAAVLAGFLMTAIPNWTGRMPLSGRPLAALFGLWVAGRIVMAAPQAVGHVAAAAVDAAFLPLLLGLCPRDHRRAEMEQLESAGRACGCGGREPVVPRRGARRRRSGDSDAAGDGGLCPARHHHRRAGHTELHP